MKYLPILLLLVGCTWEKSTGGSNTSAPAGSFESQYDGAGFTISKNNVDIPTKLLKQEEHEEWLAWFRQKHPGSEPVGVNKLTFIGFNLFITFAVKSGAGLTDVQERVMLKPDPAKTMQTILIHRGLRDRATRADEKLPSITLTY